ncbi:MAG: ribonuclease P protein component [Bacteroidetes bacterium]|nr:ribonuclease P protein component [Bacteroidota bacterium]
MSKPFSLNKYERLKSKKEIDTLFLKGKAFFVFPYKVFYLLHTLQPESEPLLFGITVPKRNFKKAVDRNRLKRVSRELYRVRKPVLKELLISNNQILHLMLVYTHHKKMTSAEIEPAIENIFKKLMASMRV